MSMCVVSQNSSVCVLGMIVGIVAKSSRCFWPQCLWNSRKATVAPCISLIITAADQAQAERGPVRAMSPELPWVQLGVGGNLTTLIGGNL